MKTIVEFPNGKLEILRGVLHIPDEKACDGRKNIVIFPNGGLMGAEGDFRCNYRIAEYLEEKGYYVLRFNPAGIGLSDGFIADCRTRDLFGAIESGLFVDDLKHAVHFVSSYQNFTNIILTGVCGGGISSLLAAAYINEVDFVIPIGMPVVLDSDKAEYNLRMSSKNAKLILGGYWYKLFSLKAWGRFLTFKSNWKTIKKALLHYFRKDLSYVKEEDPNSFRYNDHFHSAVNTIFSLNKKVLFIYGDSDTFCWEFKDLFLEKYYSNSTSRPFEYYLVPKGNHMLSLVEMQMDAAEKICQWLNLQMGSNGTHESLSP